MPLFFFLMNFIWFIPSFSCSLVMTAFSYSLMHILTLFYFLEFCFTSIAEIPHLLHLFPNPSMVRTCGGHSFRPRVRPSSPPPPLGRALLLLRPLLHLHSLPLFLLLLHLAGMIHGLGLLRHLLLIRDHPEGPELRTRASHLVRGQMSPIPHLFRV